MKNHYTAAQVADGGHLTKPKKAPLLLQAIAWTGILFVTAVGTLIASLIVAVLSLYLFSDDQLFSVFRMTFTTGHDAALRKSLLSASVSALFHLLGASVGLRRVHAC